MHISEPVPIDEVPNPVVRTMVQMIPADTPSDVTAVTPAPFNVDGVAYLSGFRRIKTTEGPDCLICMTLPVMDLMKESYRHDRIAAMIALGVWFLVVVASIFIAAQVARPLKAITSEVEAIGDFNVDPTPRVQSFIAEVDVLGGATAAMKASLRSFRKFVPADLVRDLLSSGIEARLGGEERETTIFFCDIAGFTAISEGLSPQDLVEQLGQYFRAFTEPVTATRGTVDKFIGDAVMAFWNAPNLLPNHALAACNAAIACQRRLAELRVEWRRNNQPEFYARIGINTGTVVVGNIGSEQRLNYTVIGDVVNVASRLEGLNKFYDTAIMLSDSTRTAAGDAIVARPIDWVSVKGKKKPMLVHELFGLSGDVEPRQVELSTAFSEALQRYRARNWTEAIERFEQILGLFPNDGPAKVMLQRCQAYRQQPPGDDWDGVHRMESK